MTQSNKKNKKPRIFDVEDQALNIKEEPNLNAQLADEEELKSSKSKPIDTSPETRAGKTVNSKFLSWGLLLFSSILGLFTLWLTTTLITSIEQLYERPDIIGWLAISLTALLVLSLIVIIVKEIVSLSKLKKLGSLKTAGRQIHQDNQLKPAKKYSRQIKTLYEFTPKREWLLKSLKDQEQEIMDGRELIELIDTEIGAPLDKEAQKVISETAKKVSVITAVAPGPFIDMAAVTLLNLNMIRKIATIYGVSPGLWGLTRLGRNILAHLALSGGLAMTSDLLQPLIGSSIAAKLSKKLGEGMINGALTIRIGISAQEITRPIPYTVAKKTSFAKIVSTSLTNSSKS